MAISSTAPLAHVVIYTSLSAAESAWPAFPSLAPAASVASNRLSGLPHTPGAYLADAAPSRRCARNPRPSAGFPLVHHACRTCPSFRALASTRPQCQWSCPGVGAQVGWDAGTSHAVLHSSGGSRPNAPWLHDPSVFSAAHCNPGNAPALALPPRYAALIRVRCS